MRVDCGKCQAKYSLPDARVDNKMERFNCQKCGAEIIVTAPRRAAAAVVETPPAPAASKPAAKVDFGDDSKSWMVLIHGTQHGPFSDEEMFSKLRTHELHARSYVWRGGMGEWVHISSIEPFKRFFDLATPAMADVHELRVGEHKTFALSEEDPQEERAVVQFKLPEANGFDALLGGAITGDIAPPFAIGPTVLGELPPQQLLAQAGGNERQRTQQLMLMIICALCGLVVLLVVLDALDVITVRGIGKDEQAAPQPRPQKALDKDSAGKMDTAPEGPPKTKEEARVGLEQADILKVLQVNQRGIKACYERELKRDPDLRGKLTLEFTIAGSGRVTNAAINTPEFRDKPLVGCVTAVVKAWKFPHFSGEAVTVEYPFLLSSNE